MPNRWIKKVKEHMKSAGTEGSFSRLAKRHGRTTHEEAEHDKHKPGKTGQRARLAEAFDVARRKKHGG